MIRSGQQDEIDVLFAKVSEGTFSQFLVSPERDRMKAIERAYTLDGDLTAEQREELAEIYGGTDRARLAAQRAVADWRDRFEAEESVRGRAGSDKQPVEQAQNAPSAELGWRTCSKCAGKKSMSHGEKCYCAVGGRPGMERFADPADPDAFRCRTFVADLRCGLLFGHAGGCDPLRRFEPSICAACRRLIDGVDVISIAMDGKKVHECCVKKQALARRSCNRHDDCDAANEAARAKGELSADHCHAEDCEDCFGC